MSQGEDPEGDSVGLGAASHRAGKRPLGWGATSSRGLWQQAPRMGAFPSKG